MYHFRKKSSPAFQKPGSADWVLQGFFRPEQNFEVLVNLKNLYKSCKYVSDQQPV
jgi:hypothetical protein